MTTVHDVPTYIYVLIDPRTDGVRYVGKADNPARRLKTHLRTHVDTHCTRWIRSLKELGFVPVMQVLETVVDADWIDREKHWIQHYRDQGCDLTNTTDGGDGVIGYVFTDEVRAKMSAGYKRSVERNPSLAEDRAKRLRQHAPTSEQSAELARQRWLDPEYKARVSKAISAAKSTPEARARTAVASSGPRPPEIGAKISASKKGWNPRPETRARMSEGAKRKAPPSEETRRKLREARAAYLARPGAKEQIAAAVKETKARKKAERLAALTPPRPDDDQRHEDDKHQ